MSSVRRERRWEQRRFLGSHRFCSTRGWGRRIENGERVARGRSPRRRRGNRDVVELEPEIYAHALKIYTKAVATSMGPKGREGVSERNRKCSFQQIRSQWMLVRPWVQPLGGSSGRSRDHQTSLVCIRIERRHCKPFK